MLLLQYLSIDILSTTPTSHCTHPCCLYGSRSTTTISTNCTSAKPISIQLRVAQNNNDKDYIIYSIYCIHIYIYLIQYNTWGDEDCVEKELKNVERSTGFCREHLDSYLLKEGNFIAVPWFLLYEKDNTAHPLTLFERLWNEFFYNTTITTNSSNCTNNTNKKIYFHIPHTTIWRQKCIIQQNITHNLSSGGYTQSIVNDNAASLNDRIRCSTYSGTLLITGSDDTYIRIWDIFTGRCIQVHQCNDKWITCLYTYGNLLVIGTSEKSIYI